MKNYKPFLLSIALFISMAHVKAKTTEKNPKKAKVASEKVKIALTRERINQGAHDRQHEIYKGTVADDDKIKGKVRGFYLFKEERKPLKDNEIKNLKLQNWSKKSLIKEGKLFIYCVDEKKLPVHAAFKMDTRKLSKAKLNTSKNKKIYRVTFAIMIMPDDSNARIIIDKNQQPFAIIIPPISTK